MKALFYPKSLAVIGASRRVGSVGNGIVKNLLGYGSFVTPYTRPFPGKVYPINPHLREIHGVACHGSVLDVRAGIDLAIIAVPARLVPEVMQECAKKKVKYAIIIAAGFAEYNRAGKLLQDRVLSIARKARIRVVGPNCLGLLCTGSSLNASFAPAMPPKGSVAFISQSGALADSVIDWALEARYGFSNIISVGNQSDISVSELIRYLGSDRKTRVITMYLEGITDGREFIKTTRNTAKRTPIIAIKAGRTSRGAEAIASHTGSLAGSYAIYKAALKQAGVIVVDTVEEMFDIAKAFAYMPRCRKNSIGIITNAGGPGVLCADYCQEMGIHLAELRQHTVGKLDRTGLMHPAYSRHNPLDIVGDALPVRYRAAINTLLAEEYIHGLIVIQTLQTMTDPKKDAEIIIQARRRHPNKPIVCAYLGGRFSKRGMDLLEKHQIPDYSDVHRTVRAMKALCLGK